MFSLGDTVRTKNGGPNMSVDGYTSEGEVVCTFWVGSRRNQEHFVEATLVLVPPSELKPKKPTAGGFWAGSNK